jgi:hypothetical protein
MSETAPEERDATNKQTPTSYNPYFLHSFITSWETCLICKTICNDSNCGKLKYFHPSISHDEYSLGCC